MSRVGRLAVLVTIAVLAGACGRSGKVALTPTSAPGSAETTTSSAVSGLDTGDFGDLKGVCGKAPQGMKRTASDTGVTADSIQVSTFADPGFSGRPGVNQDMFDTAEAFTKWCNEHGGVNGRKLELKLRDAKLSEFQQRVIEACDQGDFMMIGGGAVFDDTGQKNRLACGLPQIAGFLVTTRAEASDLTVEPIPNPSTELPVGDFRWLAEEHAGSKNHIGVFTASLNTLVSQAARYREAVKSLGWDEVYYAEYNPAGETTWRPFAEAMKASGVKGLIYVGEPANMAALMRALKDSDASLDWVRTDANGYDQQLVDQGGAAAEGAAVRGVLYPFLDAELATKNPATAQYRQLLTQYKPGGKIAYLGAQGLSAWLLFAVSARDCGADLTRDCVYAKAKSFTNWTAGGLHAPTDPKNGKQAQCFTLLGVHGGKFVLEPIEPTQGIYRCEPDNVIRLTGDYGTGERCPNPAYATDPKPSNCAVKG